MPFYTVDVKHQISNSVVRNIFEKTIDFPSIDVAMSWVDMNHPNSRYTVTLSSLEGYLLRRRDSGVWFGKAILTE